MGGNITRNSATDAVFWRIRILYKIWSNKIIVSSFGEHSSFINYGQLKFPTLFVTPIKQLTFFIELQIEASN